jgi:hypothetical protein
MKTNPTLGLLLLSFTTVFAMSCNKNDGYSEEKPKEEIEVPVPAAVSTKISLFQNLTSSETETGVFSITKHSNGNASVKVVMHEAFRKAGEQYKTSLVAYNVDSETDLIYAELGEVNGANGIGGKTLVTMKDQTVPLTYDMLNDFKGFKIRITKGAKTISEGMIQ